MKKLSYLIVFGLALGIVSCQSDVDLFAGYKEIPAIYGLLDSGADTNFIRITRVFSSEDDLIHVSSDPELINFPGKLDVRLVEYMNGEQTREIILDTITKHGKPSGNFAGGSQKLYYTAERLPKNETGRQYSYELIVVANGERIVSKTNMVGGKAFKVVSPHMNFSKRYFGTERFLRFGAASNALFYDVTIDFHYKERRTPTGDTIDSVYRFIEGRYTLGELFSTYLDGEYAIRYRPEFFFTGLAKYLGDDTLNVSVVRYITDYPLRIRIEAGGRELMDYLTVHDPSAVSSYGLPEVPCVGQGAVGLFSSRAVTTARGRLAGYTVVDLTDMNWGFKYIGGN